MVSRQVVAALVLAVLVALSGCTVPVGDVTRPGTDHAGDGAETVDAADESRSAGDGGRSDDDQPVAETTAEADEILTVDVYETYERVLTVLERDGEQPTVEVRDLDASLEDVYESRQDPFQESLNMTETDIDTENARGLAWNDRVVVDPNEADETDVEQTLVHEYVHTVQFSEGWSPDPTGLDSAVRTSTDYEHVETALIEGGAVWATDRYSSRYQADDVRFQSERLEREYETAPDGDRYFRAPYHYGAAYFEGRIDDPSQMPDVYENPPVTTEQLVHGHDPDEAEPTDLSVAADDGGDWTLQRNDRLGELFVRVVLETELGNDVAADAAAGWGNDRLVGYQNGGGEWGYVWVLHWDASEGADEFEAAFGTVLSERTDERADETTVERRDDRTVIVTVGSDAFRDATSVTGSGSDVGVSIDES